MLKRKKPPKRGAGRKGSRGEESPEFLSAKGAMGGSGRSTPTTRGKLLASESTASTYPYHVAFFLRVTKYSYHGPAHKGGTLNVCCELIFNLYLCHFARVMLDVLIFM